MSGTDQGAAELDRAIDDLLRDPARPQALDAEGLLPTARLLYEALPRLHPRFGFEQHLAARLAGSARPSPGPEGQAAPVTPVSLAQRVELASADARRADRRRRSLVAGGAIASGVSLAIPLAGAAWVAWRRSRSPEGLL